MRPTRRDHSVLRAIEITLTCAALAGGCTIAAGPADLDAADRGPDAELPPVAVDSGGGENDAGAVEEPTAGPAGVLLIDGSVHTGTDWTGAPYVGVWGEPMDFRMDDYPVTWAIGLVHASMLLRARGIEYSPNAVLSVAIKESRMQCALDSFPSGDGCFQIESTTAYEEMRRMFPDHFTAEHAEVVGGDHFASAAITSAYYTIFSMAMLRLHDDDPMAFFAGHPDPLAQQKVLCAAYNRGLWWNALATVFAQCTDRDVIECFEGNAIAIDHAGAIADYTIGLDAADPYDTQLDFDDLLAYWQSIRLLYPQADDAAIEARLRTAFDHGRAGSATLSFHRGIRPVLRALIGELPAMATIADATAAACDWSYLNGDACAAPTPEG